MNSDKEKCEQKGIGNRIIKGFRYLKLIARNNSDPNSLNKNKSDQNYTYEFEQQRRKPDDEQQLDHMKLESKEQVYIGNQFDHE